MVLWGTDAASCLLRKGNFLTSVPSVYLANAIFHICCLFINDDDPQMCKLAQAIIQFTAVLLLLSVLQPANALPADS